MKLIILSLDSLGDLVLRQPLVKSHIDQGNEVWIIIQERNKMLLPYWEPRVKYMTTSIYPYAPPDAEIWQEANNLLAKIKRIQADCLLVANFNHTYLDTWLLSQCLEIPRYGFIDVTKNIHSDNNDSALLSHACFVPQDLAELKKNALIFKEMTGKCIQDLVPVLTVPPSIIHDAEALISTQRLKPFQYVIGCPAGNSNVSFKNWPEKSFIHSVLYLKKKYNIAVLLTSSLSEKHMIENIATHLFQTKNPVPIWSGSHQNFGLFLGLIKFSRFYMGNDSGPMHFAAALKKPVIALFGGGTWPRFLPAAQRAVSIAKKTPCYHCYWNCPLPEPACLLMISEEQIEEGIDWMLSDSPDEQKILIQ